MAQPGVTAAPPAVRVGIVLRDVDLRRHHTDLRVLAAAIADAGLDHVTVGDHLSFRGGWGIDGFVSATAMLAADPRLEVRTGIYLLGLRHPVLVARQLSSIADLAPGRFVFGVGIGGEDPAESLAAGVDPAARASRTDESLEILSRLLSGEPTTHHGAHFDLDDVTITPAPDPPIPILVGGRSHGALRRTARVGEGWIGLWVTPERYARSVETIATHAVELGRGDVDWAHVLHLWCGYGETPEVGRERVAQVMLDAYGIEFDAFDRYTPCGTAEQVANALMPFVDIGCRVFSFIPEAASTMEAIASTGDVKRLLNDRASNPATRA